MNSEYLQIGLGVVAGLAVIPLISAIFGSLYIQVEEEESVVLSRFGRLVEVIKRPGLHFWPEKLMPWADAVHVSLKRDYRTIEEIHVNDCRGTTVIVDLWIEFRVISPEKALFQVTDREKALKSLLTNSATSILGTFEFSKILSNRSELGQRLKNDIRDETLRWGLEIDLVFISKLSLLPDVSMQLFETIAARLEKAKADIEENGRLNAALLEAETSAKVAKLMAQAKGQYSLGVSEAYKKLESNRELFEAYKELYELSLLKPHRTVTFQGFGRDEVTTMDAAMTTAATFDAAYTQTHQPGSLQTLDAPLLDHRNKPMT
jgi:regulator of protease activity HflC (stomatin/prohibitin superfamily)